MIELPFSRIGLELALNVATLGVLLHAYYMPPRGWYGPRMALFATFILCLTLVMLMVNLCTFVVSYIYQKEIP